MHQAKIYFGIILVLLLVIFTAQNVEDVTIRLFFWQLTISRALMIFFVLAIGFVIGLIVGSSESLRKEKKSSKPPGD